MKSNSVLIVGCGDLGTRLGEQLLARQWQVSAVRRDITALPRAFRSHAADYTRAGSLAFAADLQPDFVVATFNPLDRTVAGYRAGFTTAMANLLAGLGEHRPRHIIAVSSTRVFAERDGGWVDEDSPLSVDDPRAVAMIEAEALLLESGLAATVVRFAGIYGAPGGRLLSRVATGKICAASPPRYSNRIHREDCVGFLGYLLQLCENGEKPAAVYIGVDDQPAEQYVVESWLAQQLGVSAHSDAGLQRTGAGHKRCSNRRLRDSGYPLIYLDYRAGYGAVIAASGDSPTG